MRSLVTTKKKSLIFPLWVEGAVVVAAMVMAVVEGMHQHWLWMVIFGVCGIAFGISAGSRIVSGDKHGGA